LAKKFRNTFHESSYVFRNLFVNKKKRRFTCSVKTVVLKTLLLVH